MSRKISPGKNKTICNQRKQLKGVKQKQRMNGKKLPISEKLSQQATNLAISIAKKF